mmetsp:Transcript_12380/g.52097  ORF Transcript_12380/g.52097 Transcript_12380/m.52097 type:complete len:96 (+) Transcript_12380:1500-1787(+)
MLLRGTATRVHRPGTHVTYTAPRGPFLLPADVIRQRSPAVATVRAPPRVPHGRATAHYNACTLTTKYGELLARVQGHAAPLVLIGAADAKAASLG